MIDKTTQTQKQTKADLRKMLADAVLNTPGATPLEPVRDAPSKPQPNQRSGMKRPGKTKRAGVSSSRTARNVSASAKRL